MSVTYSLKLEAECTAGGLHLFLNTLLCTRTDRCFLAIWLNLYSRSPIEDAHAYGTKLICAFGSELDMEGEGHEGGGSTRGRGERTGGKGESGDEGEGEESEKRDRDKRGGCK